MSISEHTSIYDRLRPHLDAADLIARLGLKCTRTLGSEAYCSPLCHESASGESLQINLHTGRWNCKACQHAGMYGDLIQLVEYVLSGGQVPSKGDQQRDSPSHLVAMKWLCEQFGVPFNHRHVRTDGALEVLHVVMVAAHRNLLESPDVLRWIEEQWGFDQETVSSYGIGYLPPQLLPAIINESKRPASMPAFKASGLGWFDGTRFRTHFAGRVLFPYLEHGRATYLIGRVTPWTPAMEGGRNAPKYHKLSVHSETRPWISERITNDHLYNEPVMKGAKDLGVLEGVTDAVAISSLGACVVSPVTISFNAVDLERFLRKCREQGIERVWILFDNELSGSGTWGARSTGKKIILGGVDARVVTLPLGPTQQAARDEVMKRLGAEAFALLERADPRERKEILASTIIDERERAWITDQVKASKIDGAEWCAMEGAGAAGKFDALIKTAQNVIDLEAQDVVFDKADAPTVRADAFNDVIALVAHLRSRMARESYGTVIAKAAGKGVSATEIRRRIAQYRREVVEPKRKDDKARTEEQERKSNPISLMVPPPEPYSKAPAGPAAPTQPSGSSAPAAPTLPGAIIEEKDRYGKTRGTVGKLIDRKEDHEVIGLYVADVITISMGYMVFQLPGRKLVLVRQNEKIPIVGRNASWKILLYRASGMASTVAKHRIYIEALEFHLSERAPEVKQVSWSHVTDDAVYFPLADNIGQLAKLSDGEVTLTRISEELVPAVQTPEFAPLVYTKETGGVQRALDLFRWISLSEYDRILLVYWAVCFPLMHRIRVVPIVRIEGGSSSGKTRVVDALSYLVNKQEAREVPSSPALISKLAELMLTVDDNRESLDVSPHLRSTLLQATQLGARTKRAGNTDTGTVTERVQGALLMNGIEPIHDGKSELASRMLTLRAHSDYVVEDSPTADETLHRQVAACRDAFWSDALRRCAAAMETDKRYGEPLGQQIIGIFGATRIGRLSAYMRVMYQAWVAGLPENQQQQHLVRIAPLWVEAFEHVAKSALASLVIEELSVLALKYAFNWCQDNAEQEHTGSDWYLYDPYFRWNKATGEQVLGELRISRLADLARRGGHAANAPDKITRSLSAGQLTARVVDGIEFIKEAGFAIELAETKGGRMRGKFARFIDTKPGTALSHGSIGDTWDGGYG